MPCQVGLLLVQLHSHSHLGVVVAMGQCTRVLDEAADPLLLVS